MLSAPNKSEEKVRSNSGIKEVGFRKVRVSLGSDLLRAKLKNRCHKLAECVWGLNFNPTHTEEKDGG